MKLVKEIKEKKKYDKDLITKFGIIFVFIINRSLVKWLFSCYFLTDIVSVNMK